LGSPEVQTPWKVKVFTLSLPLGKGSLTYVNEDWTSLVFCLYSFPTVSIVMRLIDSVQETIAAGPYGRLL
jgi:hypothetical protein